MAKSYIRRLFEVFDHELTHDEIKQLIKENEDEKKREKEKKRFFKGIP